MTAHDITAYLTLFRFYKHVYDKRKIKKWHTTQLCRKRNNFFLLTTCRRDNFYYLKEREPPSPTLWNFEYWIHIRPKTMRRFQDLFFWDLFFPQELFIHWGLINCVKILVHPHLHPRPHPLQSHSSPHPHFGLHPHLHSGHRPHTRNWVGFISKCIRIFQ